MSVLPLTVRGIMIMTIVNLFMGANAFALSGGEPKTDEPAQNGGVIFQKPVDKLQQSRDNEVERAEAAKKKTEELNKKWRAQQKKFKEAEARAKAKRAAQQKKAKKKK